LSFSIEPTSLILLIMLGAAFQCGMAFSSGSQGNHPYESLPLSSAGIEKRRVKIYGEGNVKSSRKFGESIFALQVNDLEEKFFHQDI